MRAMFGIQLKDRKRSTDLMSMLSLNETTDQLAMTYSARWCGHVLRRGWPCLEKDIGFLG